MDTKNWFFVRDFDEVDNLGPYYDDVIPDDLKKMNNEVKKFEDVWTDF